MTMFIYIYIYNLSLHLHLHMHHPARSPSSSGDLSGPLHRGGDLPPVGLRIGPGLLELVLDSPDVLVSSGAAGVQKKLAGFWHLSYFGSEASLE